MEKTKKILTLREKLLVIQTELKAPKSQLNKFGNYNYRSCEDILEALKPLLKENRVVLTIGDKIVKVGDRYYVKSGAEIKDLDSESSIFVNAYAREEETKKGMDGSQITGASSSYARKYALNGLFGIDDSKDSDTTNKHEDKKVSENVSDDVKTVIVEATEPGFYTLDGTLNTARCAICNQSMFWREGEFKSGKNKGKKYTALFCESQDIKHAVWYPKLDNQIKKSGGTE
jgi:hypothetical protein